MFGKASAIKKETKKQFPNITHQEIRIIVKERLIKKMSL